MIGKILSIISWSILEVDDDLSKHGKPSIKSSLLGEGTIQLKYQSNYVWLPNVRLYHATTLELIMLLAVALCYCSVWLWGCPLCRQLFFMWWLVQSDRYWSIFKHAWKPTIGNQLVWEWKISLKYHKSYLCLLIMWLLWIISAPFYFGCWYFILFMIPGESWNFLKSYTVKHSNQPIWQYLWG